MDIRIIAVGRIRGAEAELVIDYLERAAKSGRAFGINKIEMFEIDERKSREQIAQIDAIRSAVGGEKFWLLDERGNLQTSPKFAENIAHFRDHALGRLNFVIGGADGVDEALRSEAQMLLSFGKMVWPHLLARVMLTEQIYRAMTIWSGSPYHRV